MRTERRRRIMLSTRAALAALLACAALALAGCRDDDAPAAAPEAPQAGETAAAAQPIAVRADATGLLFRYYDPDERRMKTARRVDDVPEGARARVIVHEEAALLDYRAGQPLTVADLRTPDDAGSYPSELVNPLAFERALPETAPAAAPPPPGAPAGAPAVTAARAGSDDVILFSTDWCPHCRRARSFLERRGVPFVERDVEKDPKARPLLAKLGQRAGVDPALLTSVPILWVKGRLLLGFDEEQVAGLLGR